MHVVQFDIEIAGDTWDCPGRFVYSHCTIAAGPYTVTRAVRRTGLQLLAPAQTLLELTFGLVLAHATRVWSTKAFLDNVNLLTIQRLTGSTLQKPLTNGSHKVPDK